MKQRNNNLAEVEITKKIRIIEEMKSGNFADMARIVGLDPANDFKWLNLSGVDFTNSDLTGFDFTGCNLKKCKFGEADISGATFGMNACDSVVIIMMGVSGCGKTTIADLLARSLGWKYQEGDHLHPEANVEKMRSGRPLTDADRQPWLKKIAEVIDRWRASRESGVITCSALKRSYRNTLIASRPEIQLVYLQGAYDLIRSRLAARLGHYMPTALLDSQFKALEEPAANEYPIVIDVRSRPTNITTEIIRQLLEREAIGESEARLAAELLLAEAVAKQDTFEINE